MPERNHRQATRAFWSGTITFGLVSIPVDLFAAVQGRDTAMRMVDAKGEPLGRRYYCPKDGKALSSDDIVRGYEIKKGKMVVVTDEELAAIAPEMTRDIELRRFVPRDEIPAAYYNRPYFLAPSGRSGKAYHLLAAVMESTGRVGVGTFVMRDHQYLVAILSDGGILRAETLRFADELRSSRDVGLPKPKKTPAKKIKQFAKAIADLVHDDMDIDEISDWYAGEIHKLVERKKDKGQDVIDIKNAESEEAEEGAEVIDLMKVLKQRLSATAERAKAHRANGARSAHRSSHKKRKKAA